jgi:hypothetical protein
MDLKIARIHRIHTNSTKIASFEIPTWYQGEYADLVKKCAKDDLFDLILSPPKKIRTTGELSQNHHFNGHLAQICQETGNEFADVKLYVKRRAFKRGLSFMTKENGAVVYSLVDGEPLPVSETKMTTIECGYCIDECHELAAELGIRLIEE